MDLFKHSNLIREATVPKVVRNSYLKNNRELKEILSYIKSNKDKMICYRSGSIFLDYPIRQRNKSMIFEIGSQFIVEVFFMDSFLMIEAVYKDNPKILGTESKIILSDILRHYDFKRENNLFYSIANLNNLIKELNSRNFKPDKCNKKNRHVISNKMSRDNARNSDIYKLASRILEENKENKVLCENIKENIYKINFIVERRNQELQKILDEYKK